MKLRIFLLAVVLCIILGTVLFFPRIAPIVRLPDRCPQGQQVSLQKTQALIEHVKDQWEVSHPNLHFQFRFPDSGWRFEENTIQEREEPISLPSYIYTFFLSEGEYDERKKSPNEVRLVIYPTWCNSESQWGDFLVTQGWQRVKDTRYVRNDAGRKSTLYFFHGNALHYELMISVDPMNSTRSENEWEELIRQFIYTK